MPTIRQLSSSVVNKIAAGEVIERPASVVKELLENAIDAGATRIDVQLQAGGRELIRVTDNGCGMEADQLPLAVTNHATSKIQTADDLFEVATMGFRGEALASIAEVSRTTIRSRTADGDGGAELRVRGGVAEPIEPAGCPVGTTIEVRDLFFNTPVRQRFLRTPQTEIGHATEAFVRIALAHPSVHCRLSHGQREVHDLAPTDNWRQRIAELFGDELADGLIEVESIDEPISLRGYAANPSHSRANNRLQYLFLNGRNIRDRALQHALGEAYRGLLLTGRYPICFLRFDMPPNLADVNVHPTKLEVRFQDGGRLYSQLLGTLRSKFLSTDLRATAEGHSNGTAAASAANEDLVSRRSDPATSPTARGPRSMSQQRLAAGDYAPSAVGQPLTMHRVPSTGEKSVPAYRPHGPVRSPRAIPAMVEEEAGQDISEEIRHETAYKTLQLHNRYLVVETAEGMEILDQHALHERILYQQIRAKVDAEGLEKQKLLVPEPIDLTAEEAAAVLENASLLARLAIDVEPFGGETVLISSYPAMLAKLPPREVLGEIVERLTTAGQLPEGGDLLDDLLHTIACKGAVKYGDRLTESEIEALLQQRQVTQNHHHCPHGRPTSLVFSCDDLDKQFKRT